MEYSVYPTRAFDNLDNKRMLQGLEQLADAWGIDLTDNLEHDQEITDIIEGQNNGTE